MNKYTNNNKKKSDRVRADDACVCRLCSVPCAPPAPKPFTKENQIVRWFFFVTLLLLFTIVRNSTAAAAANVQNKNALIVTTDVVQAAARRLVIERRPSPTGAHVRAVYTTGKIDRKPLEYYDVSAGTARQTQRRVPDLVFEGEPI